MADFSPLITVAELRHRLADAELRILDCRFELSQPDAGHEAWLHGHIPGAVFADLDRDLAAPVTETTGRHPLPGVRSAAETFSRLGVANASTVVVYDADNGGIAARAWWMLSWLGHERVALLDGGLRSWELEGLPLERGHVDVTPATFDPVPSPDCEMTTAEVAAGVRDGEVLRLVDARAAARFRGEAEPIDAVAGHVPGATNLPFTDILKPDGCWKSPAEIRQLLVAALGDATSAPWTVMCGSGVTACHLALAARLSGISEPRVYVGSWSEWIRDPGRPVATGA